MNPKKHIKLDKLDKRIVHELDTDARQPISKLSKKLRASRTVLDYKIRRMEREGLIKNYVTLLNPGRLGLMIWNVYLEFENMTKEIEEKITANVKENPKIWWAAKTAGNWDFVYSVVVKNVKEFEKIFFEFNSLFGRYILRQIAVAHGTVDVISRSFLPEQPGTSVEWFGKYEPLVFDSDEKEILHLLGFNSKMRIKDISKKTGLNPKTVVSKIKGLEQNGTITRYRLQLDVSKLGLHFYKAIVHLKDYSEEKDKELAEYCRELGNVFHYERKIGSWPLELEMDVGSYEEAEKTMYSMKERFSDFIERYELLLIKEEIKGELDLSQFI